MAQGDSQAGTGVDRFDEWAQVYDLYYPAGSRKDLEFRLSRKLILAARRWTNLIDETIRLGTGQRRAGWQTLFALAFAARPLTTLELSERVGVQWPALVRTLNGLEAEGLVRRSENPDDGRSRLIDITDAGQKLVADVQEVLDPTRGAVLAGMTDDEVLIATRLLDKVLNGATDPR